MHVCIYIYTPITVPSQEAFFARFRLRFRPNLASQCDHLPARLGAGLERSWGRLGPVCPPGGRLGAVLGPHLDPLGPSWGHLSAFATKKAILSKVYVFLRFWPLFGLLRSLAAVKLGSTWGQFCNFNEVRRNSSLRRSSEHVLMASRSHSFRSRRPKAPQEGPEGAPKGPQRGGPEGGKTGYEIGLELEGLFGPILEPFGSSS